MLLTYEQLTAAHSHSSHHREEILASEQCGCFDCLSIFSPSEIKEWADAGRDPGQSALCPKCGIDSVIGDKSGFPLTKDFLREMQLYWFGDAGIDLSNG